MDFGDDQEVRGAFEPRLLYRHGPIVITRQEGIEPPTIALSSGDDRKAMLERGNP